MVDAGCRCTLRDRRNSRADHRARGEPAPGRNRSARPVPRHIHHGVPVLGPDHRLAATVVANARRVHGRAGRALLLPGGAGDRGFRPGQARGRRDARRAQLRHHRARGADHPHHRLRRHGDYGRRRHAGGAAVAAGLSAGAGGPTGAMDAAGRGHRADGGRAAAGRRLRLAVAIAAQPRLHLAAPHPRRQGRQGGGLPAWPHQLPAAGRRAGRPAVRARLQCLCAALARPWRGRPDDAGAGRSQRRADGRQHRRGDRPGARAGGTR